MNNTKFFFSSTLKVSSTFVIDLSIKSEKSIPSLLIRHPSLQLLEKYKKSSEPSLGVSGGEYFSQSINEYSSVCCFSIS